MSLPNLPLVSCIQQCKEGFAKVLKKCKEKVPDAERLTAAHHDEEQERELEQEEEEERQVSVGTLQATP